MKPVLDHQGLLCLIFGPYHEKICLCDFKQCTTLDGKERDKAEIRTQQ